MGLMPIEMIVAKLRLLFWTVAVFLVAHSVAQDSGHTAGDRIASGRSANRGFGALDATSVSTLRSVTLAAWRGKRGGMSTCDVDGGGKSCRVDGDVDKGAIASTQLPLTACEAEALLLRALRMSYRSPNTSGAILDGGSFVGHFTADVLTAFGDLESRKYAKEFGQKGQPCPAPSLPSVSIYAIEPAVKNYQRLSDRAKRSGWQLEAFSLMKAGLANASGKAPLWAEADAVDPLASFSQRAGVPSHEARMVTLDLLVKKTVAEGRLFLAKLSLNGHEQSALISGKKSLKKRLIRFLFVDLERTADSRFGQSVEFLWKLGYACFAVLPQPLPISGPFWDEIVETNAPHRLRLFCGQLDDPGLSRALRALDPASPDYAGHG